ncbi:MAG: UvrD-helicase domain-containing protein [Methanobrevibacter sp.]|jgi:DNA helicase-2/ATP-dependent DNA helicase PcrA|nr:UvrD-helicase domain-containing protein [Methanobrevibacter sp.]
MISYSKFKDVVVNELKRDISSNKDQNKAISANKEESLFIVAGPGSGKTTVMVLKILKFVFVDDIKPNEILATTFTRKAANELHSRILSWGDAIKKYLLKTISDERTRKNIHKIDFNQIITGTIDSIAEEILRIHRDPGTNLPVVIEDFVANSTMISEGLFNKERYLNKDLQEYLGSITGVEKVKNPSKMSNLLLDIKNRLYYDQVDMKKIIDNDKSLGAKEALNSIEDYKKALDKNNIIDFTMLETRFLKRLESGKLDIFLDEIKIVLIDEYQDTNLLQEKIYFTIAKSAIKNGGNITVVGDDDQSLYRFRGATVDLFTNFIKRAKKELEVDVCEINLSTNYRSSEHIVNLCNHFVELDNEYQNARVKEKPKIEFSKYSKEELSTGNLEDIPVLGMFRQNQEILAKDLSILIKDLVEGKEVKKKIKKILRPNSNASTFNLKNNVINNENSLQYNHIKRKLRKNKEIILKLDPNNGSPSDIAILTYSPKELSYGNHLFPHYLRKNLSNFKKPIDIFNPRGQDLQTLDSVAIFCGLILECIDPESKFQKSIKKIPKLAERNMNKWRRIANEFINTFPEPHDPVDLKTFVDHWKARIPLGHDHNIWPESASLIELSYKLITWINDLQNDIEGIVYLEAITQTITQTGFFNTYESQIYFDDKHIKEKDSVKEAIWNIFIPIATGGVSIDENLLDTLPNNRINIMSIHQSKGLEFPLVIVDVGSRFKKNRVKTSFLRFPKEGGKSANLENKIRPHSPIGVGNREAKDRAFDDLTRLYFVAFSRAQDVLLLVGLNSAIDGYMVDEKHKKIPNVALGWRRDEIFVGFDEIHLI